MHELYKLKDMLCEELKEYGSKSEMSAGSLEIVDKLSHAIKNLDKIIEKYEEEEEGYSGNYMYERGGNRGGSYAYTRSRGANARRDSMGRYSNGYSRNDGKEEMVMQLREMMHDAPNDRTRMRIQELIQDFEMQ